MKSIRKIIAAWLLIFVLLLNVVSCNLLPNNNGGQNDNTQLEGEFYIDGPLTLRMTVGESVTLKLIKSDNLEGEVVWTSSSDCATVENGKVYATEA